MTLFDDKFYIKASWILIAGFMLFRVFYSSTFLLIPDETNYWQWSRHLALGYHDQAPMIAWLIKLTTVLLGHTEIGVRLPSVLSIGIASAYLVAIAGRWINPIAAFNTALLTQVALGFNVGGLIATPDAIQAAAWAGASYHVARAYDKGKLQQWLLGGLWFGFGILSKYTMVIFLPCAFFYGIFSKKHRLRLTSIWPYAGVLLGTFMFSPVIFWNAQNSWNSVRHVAHLGGVNEPLAIHLDYLLGYLLSQAGLLSPFVFILIILAWTLSLNKKFASENWIYMYLFFTSFPMFAGFALLSLHDKVYGNWAGAGYLTAFVLAAAFFGRKMNHSIDTKLRIGQRIWPWAIGTSFFFSALLLFHIHYPVLPIPSKLDRTKAEIAGWKELGKKADEMLKSMPDTEKTFLFGLRYQIASELAFYTPGQPQTVSINKWKRPNVYDYWWEDEDLLGWNAIGVSKGSRNYGKLLGHVFDHVDPPVKITIFETPIFSKNGASKKPVKNFYLYRAYGFKGGLRWVPPDSSDIRAG